MPCVIGEGRRGRHVAIINKDTKRIVCKFETKVIILCTL